MRVTLDLLRFTLYGILDNAVIISASLLCHENYFTLFCMSVYKEGTSALKVCKGPELFRARWFTHERELLYK